MPFSLWAFVEKGSTDPLITRITLENFMSHEHTVLDLVPGLNVLVGPNNSGKSALIAALQIVCENPRGTDYVIRHGCNRTTITIETEENHTVSWSRSRNGGVHYIINGREIHRGRTPTDLHEILRLPNVEAGDAGGSFDVHFGEQKSPIFLLDKPGSHAASFFASASDAAKLMAMQRRHRENERDARKEIRIAEEKLRSLAEELAVLEPLDQIQKEAADLLEVYESLQGRRELITRLTDFASRFERVIIDEHGSSQTLRSLGSLHSPPELLPASRLQATLAGLVQTTEAMDHAERCSLALLELLEPPGLQPTQSLEQLLGGLRNTILEEELHARVSGALRRLSIPPLVHRSEELAEFFLTCQRAVEVERAAGKRAQAVAHLTEPPSLLVTNELESKLYDLERARADLDHPCRVLEALDSLLPAPELRDPSVLEKQISKLETVIQEELSSDATLDGTQNRLKELQLQLKELVGEISTCPTCGGPLDADTLIRDAISGK